MIYSVSIEQMKRLHLFLNNDFFNDILSECPNLGKINDTHFILNTHVAISLAINYEALSKYRLMTEILYHNGYLYLQILKK